MPDLPTPPIAEPEPVTHQRFGVTRTDEYAWLRERENPEVLAHLGREREYAEAVLAAHTGDLRPELYRELRGRIKETDQSVPVREGDFYYYERTEEGSEYSIHCRRRGSMDAPEEIYLDENLEAADHDYYAIGGMAVTDDHRILAYAVDTSGDEIFDIVFKDLSTGQMLGDRLTGCSGALEWATDHAHLFYATLDPAHRPHALHRHRLGDRVSEDAKVMQEDDERFYLSVYRTRSRAFIIVSLGSQVTTEAHLIPSDEPRSQPRVVAPRRQDVEYYVDHDGDRFVVLTNDEAQNFRIMTAPLDTPSAEHWVELVAHDEKVLVEDVDAFSGHWVIWEREGGLRRLRVVPKADPGKAHFIEFPDPAYTIWPGANPHYDTDTLRFGYSSMTTPASVFSYHLDTRARLLLKQAEVVGGHDPNAYTSRRTFARAPDGTMIPISLVSRADLRPGPAPCLLYGYGAYGHSIDPRFSANRLSLLDRGAVFAIAHVRGGDAMGRAWYEAGKLEHKPNTFHDFIACAEHLVSEGITAPDRLAAQGGSAGGLLIGAVANLRPDLFTAMIADVPFVDCLNTMLDASLPLTVVEYEEWGDPNEETAFRTIMGYAPYENVVAQDYPHLLVLAGLEDPRVGYWEPAKWVARLRARKTDTNLLLLWTNLEAGHGGASGRFQYLEEIALEYAFLIDRLALPAQPS